MIKLKFLAILALTFSCIAIYPKSFKSSYRYTKKTPYAGFGKKSSNTGRIKTKSTKGHFKKGLGYKFVHSYSRS